MAVLRKLIIYPRLALLSTIPPGMSVHVEIQLGAHLGDDDTVRDKMYPYILKERIVHTGYTPWLGTNPVS